MNLLATLMALYMALSNPAQHARSYMDAWRSVDGNLTLYLLSRSDGDILATIQAVHTAEAALRSKDP
jgi:hypothetical protein